MAPPSSTIPPGTTPAAVAGLGGWLFARRGWLPVPLLAAMYVGEPVHWGPGLLVVAVGEGIRLAAVGYIGLPSRTRSASVGPLVRAGPYGWVRNPLYLGNIAIFLGIGLLFWPSAVVVVPLLAAYYSFIVRWEEANLAVRLGASYTAYLAGVPRWLPRPPAVPAPGRWSFPVAVRSERSTFLALAVLLGAAALRAWAA